MTIIAYIITLNKANMAEKDFLVKDQDTRVNDDSRVNQNSSEDQDNWFFGLITQLDPIIKEFDRISPKKRRTPSGC